MKCKSDLMWNICVCVSNNILYDRVPVFKIPRNSENSSFLLLMTTSRPGMFHPFIPFGKHFLARRAQHIRKRVPCQYILQVLADCFQHSLTHYLLSHIFSWVKGFSSLFCFVPIFFFLLSKTHLPTPESLFMLHAHPHPAGSAVLQRCRQSCDL